MNESEIHLKDYLKVIHKRRYTVYTFFVIVFVVVLVGTFSTKPVYMASAKILIEKGEPRTLMMNYGYIPYDPEFYETQYQLIKSVSVAKRVVDMLDLGRTYDSYFGDGSKGFSPVGWIAGLFSAGSPAKGAADPKGGEETSRADTIAKMISGNIVVRPVKNSKIANVGFLSTNPGFAKSVVNTVAQAYIEEILELNMSSTRYTLHWMTKKAEEEKEKLGKSEKALQQYMKDHNFVTLENKIAIIPQKLSELNSQLIRAETKKKEAETLYGKVKDLTDNLQEAETIAVIAGDPSLQSLRQQILKAEQSIMELSQKYGKKHPAMMRAAEDLNVLKTKKEQEIRRVIESIRNEYEMAKANEANLRRLLSETKGDALNVNEKYIEYGVLNREVETNRQLYDALIRKIKEQSITEQIQNVNVMIVEKADTPKSPIKPRRALNVLLGILVGLFGGVGMAFFVEYLDQTVKSPEDVETKLGVPVLGVIPLLKTEGKNIDEIVRKEPQSVLAENYKVIRTSILLSSADRPHRSILVTSASSGEGKTATSVNLAVTIAHAELPVLLVDADLRRPRIHKIFDLHNSKGLSTYLAGASDSSIVVEEVLPNLSVIPSGPIPPNPSELLGSGRMRDLIESLSGKFRVVIWDSAPLLTVTDSLILSRILDGTIIVTKAGTTTYESLRRSLNSLGGRRQEDTRPPFLGVVINAVDVKKGDYYYDYYRHYYYSADEVKPR